MEPKKEHSPSIIEKTIQWEHGKNRLEPAIQSAMQADLRLLSQMKQQAQSQMSFMGKPLSLPEMAAIVGLPKSSLPPLNFPVLERVESVLSGIAKAMNNFAEHLAPIMKVCAELTERMAPIVKAYRDFENLPEQEQLAKVEEERSNFRRAAKDRWFLTDAEIRIYEIKIEDASLKPVWRAFFYFKVANSTELRDFKLENIEREHGMIPTDEENAREFMACFEHWRQDSAPLGVPLGKCIPKTVGTPVYTIPAVVGLETTAKESDGTGDVQAETGVGGSPSLPQEKVAVRRPPGHWNQAKKEYVDWLKTREKNLGATDMIRYFFDQWEGKRRHSVDALDKLRETLRCAHKKLWEESRE